jgi:alkylhydroperoxidase family enzyme
LLTGWAWAGATDMAYIAYVPDDQIPAEDDVPDHDHITRIHGVHARTMRQHYELYAELMRGPGPLSRLQRELIAVSVSRANHCHY